MTWVWEWPREDWGADYDYSVQNALELQSWSRMRIPMGSIKPIYRSKASVERFKSLHCPPMGSDAVVDDVWEKIILKFVPHDRIQFYPVRLIAQHGKTYDNFKWVIPFDRLECIDVEKSRFTTIDRTVNPPIYLGLKKVIHRPGGIGKLHIARDVNLESHLLVSDELRDALAATGGSSMFYRPEDLPIVGRD
jgi:hypothetical protein